MREKGGRAGEGGECVVFMSKSPEETRAIGALLAETLVTGDFIALDGELASGKTCFVQGLAAGLGYSGQATSPTFTLLHLYEGGRLPLYHFDVYRLTGQEELEGLGYEDYFYSDGVCAVEWSARIPDYLPERRIGITFERASAGGHRLTMRLYGYGSEGWPASIYNAI